MATLHYKPLALALLTVTLAACGGGSGGGSSAGNGGNGNNGDYDTLTVTSQPHAQGVVLSWTAVSGASSYTVYSDDEEISRSSPASGTTSATCSSSPCRILTDELGLQHILVVANGTNYRSVDQSVVVGAMNDSGFDKCFGTVDGFTSSSADCATAPAAAGQDGVNGRDANAALVKTGAGPKGFDFTKLDASGYELADSASEWRCVRDNVTGRVWEVKQTDPTVALNDNFDDAASLYDGRRTFNFTGNTAAVYSGEVADVTFSGSVNNLISQANNDGLCGKTNWRLPSQQELLGILDMGTLDISTTTYPQLGEFEMKTTEAIGGSGGYETFINSGYLTATQVLAGAASIHVIDARNKSIIAAVKSGGQQLATYAKDSNCVKPSASSDSCVYAGYFARLVSN